MLPMSTQPRPVARGLVLAPQHVQKVRVTQPGGPVSQAFLVDQQREPNPRLLLEQARVVRVAQPDGRQVGAPLAEGMLVCAQLRDVLAAEDSTIVPQEDHHRRLPLPKRAEADFASIRVGQNHRSQRFGEHLRKCKPSAHTRNPSSAATGSCYRDGAPRRADRRCHRIDRSPPCGSPRRNPANACAARCPASPR